MKEKEGVLRKTVNFNQLYNVPFVLSPLILDIFKHAKSPLSFWLKMETSFLEKKNYSKSKVKTKGLNKIELFL